MFKNQSYKTRKKPQLHHDHNVAKIEKETGLSFKNVKIYYASDKPKQYQANAVAFGSNVYLKSGHENKLKHELGHVKQQEYGLVKANCYTNGQPMNTEKNMEQDANHILNNISKGKLQHNKTPVKLIQRSFDTSAALKLNTDQYPILTSDQLLVDSIKLAGRPKTKLKSEEGKATQGDHIIADALIKKYQKVMVKNRTVREAYGFYYNLCDQIKSENNLALLNMAQQAEPKMAIDPAIQGRIQASAQKSENLQARIWTNINIAKPQTEWRKELTSILYDYNTTYAESYFATHGIGTGGKDEKTGMQYVRETLSITDSNLKPTMLNKLIDKDSLHRAIEEIGNISELQKLELSNLVLTRFQSMLIEMANYRNHSSDISLQNMSPYLYAPVAGGYSGMAAQFVNDYASKFMLDENDVCEEICNGMTQINTNLSIMDTYKISFTNFKNTITILKKMDQTFHLIPDTYQNKQEVYNLIHSVYDPFIMIEGSQDITNIISAVQRVKKEKKQKQQTKKVLQKKAAHIASMDEADQLSDMISSVEQESQEIKGTKALLIAAFSSETNINELPNELKPVYTHVMGLAKQIPDIINHISILIELLKQNVGSGS